MDKEIFNRYQDLKTPFNGEVLYTKTTISLEDLRKLVQIILNFLRVNNLLNARVYKVWDWFEHDGYLHHKDTVSEAFLTDLVTTSEQLYLNRSGETNVKLGLYDECSRWYFRIYIIDEYDLKEGEALGGTVDISLNKDIVNLFKKHLLEKEGIELECEVPLSYFEKRYAGGK